eukprot:2626406-Prymnesium_polylepis.1
MSMYVVCRVCVCHTRRGRVLRPADKEVTGGVNPKRARAARAPAPAEGRRRARRARRVADRMSGCAPFPVRRPHRCPGRAPGACVRGDM